MRQRDRDRDRKTDRARDRDRGVKTMGIVKLNGNYKAMFYKPIKKRKREQEEERE